MKIMKIKNLFLVLFTCTALHANASRYYVNPIAFGNGSGNSWINGFNTLSAAFSAAVSGDEIWVKAGNYKPGTLRTSSFTIPNGVKLYGSFAGTETTLAERDFNANTTTLNGDIGAVGTATDNVFRVVIISGTGIVMDGFRIINGYANDSSSPNYYAGAIFFSGTATLTNCIIANNYAKEAGGAIYISSGNLTLNKCNISGNRSSWNGGAIFVTTGSTLKTIGCSFTDNNSSKSGGAVFVDGGATLTVDKCKLSSNRATETGSVVQSSSTSSFYIFNSLVVGNSGGSCISTSYSSTSTKITNCTIADNASGVTGAPQILNSIVWNNGGIQVETSAIKQNCIIQYITNNPSLGLFNYNPLFVSPGDFTLAPFTDDGYDYHFLASSPAANNGDNTALSAVYNQDLDGLARIQATTIDMGCYESSFVATENSVNSQNTGITYYNQTISVDENADLIGKTANIYNIEGKLVQTITNIQSQTTLENLSIGVYIIKIEEKAMKFMYQ
jgi:predicted outer membrane repeat protein